LAWHVAITDDPNGVIAVDPDWSGRGNVVEVELDRPVPGAGSATLTVTSNADRVIDGTSAVVGSTKTVTIQYEMALSGPLAVK
ncbi:hypothetical protein ACFL1X_11175, partial [Candidatus Hydrogenedentota bacterium]